MQVGIYYRTAFSSAGKDGKIKKSRITLGIRFAVALAYHAFVYAKCRYLTISFIFWGHIARNSGHLSLPSTADIFRKQDGGNDS